jgi:hypothetical protein
METIHVETLWDYAYVAIRIASVLKVAVTCGCVGFTEWELCSHVEAVVKSNTVAIVARESRA